MKWRVLVLLVSGFAMIYFVSLLQDTPYPHPVLVQTFLPKKTRTNEPSRVILRQTGDYVYRTHVHDEAVLEANKGFVLLYKQENQSRIYSDPYQKKNGRFALDTYCLVQSHKYPLVQKIQRLCNSPYYTISYKMIIFNILSEYIILLMTNIITKT
ncbi:uncharacterized protein B0P05DRAFT_362616 [Gilbertella persicaria]|uniref:uncharacterized protein n=1 Tax=Gilbertella persicaria TaxID=101096 RepID=UPI00221F764E|nr:uncharacterized protein B0P05DRAFT_362616 [Gilbertella persicaria]KAI8047436.1 hypothetical protein B0P05DRAFT_362616 [Gilbertella persicaria]